LLDESVEAHRRAIALDPTLTTSVTHTHFLRCEYQAALDTYGTGARYYLDAAAWAGLGDTKRAATLLRERLESPQLAPLMRGVMGSLLAVLDGRHDKALQMIREQDVTPEPEVLFYLARHCGMIGAAAEAAVLVKRARLEGFASSRTLERDAAFAAVRKHAAFAREVELARERERDCRRGLTAHLGRHELSKWVIG
jgi:hypothetical protein